MIAVFFVILFSSMLSNCTAETNFRIHVIGAYSELGQHREGICFIHTNSQPALRVRFHLPIVTNDQAMMFIEDNYYHFDEKKIYFFHNGCVHATANHHLSKERIHLV